MTDRDELMLDSMGATPNGFEIKTHAGGPQTAETLLFIADSMRSMLDEHEAPNYLEMELKGTDGKRYIMTLQRAGKVTPHEARVKAEEALEASKPRTITTPEELKTLPNDSVLLSDEGGVFQLDFGLWREVGTRDCMEAHEISLPATVLHEPEAGK